MLLLFTFVVNYNYDKNFVVNYNYDKNKNNMNNNNDDDGDDDDDDNFVYNNKTAKLRKYNSICALQNR